MLPLCPGLFLSWLGDIISESATRESPEPGIKKHRVRSVYDQPHILYTMRRHKHPQTQRHKSHNRQKAIFEPQRKRRLSKTNLSSTGGRRWVDESVDS